MGIFLGSKHTIQNGTAMGASFKSNSPHRKGHVPRGITLSGDSAEGDRQWSSPRHTHILILD